MMSGSQFVWKNPTTVGSSVTSIFGRTGDILGQIGDYTTALVTESGSNLYFTDLRAQNALSGSIGSLSGTLASLSGTVNTLSGMINLMNANYTTLTFSVAGIGNSQIALQNNFNALSGSLTSLSGVVL